MELKPGYKQTEVGVIPEDWDTAKVGQSFEVFNQLRLPLSRSVRSVIPGPFPYYGPTGVQGWINEYRVEGKYALIGEDGDHFLKWQLQPMTKLVEGRFNVNNHAHLVKGSHNLTEWFYWYFCNRDITAHLTRQGAGRFKLAKAALVDIPCALPPLDEQSSITKTLYDIDLLLASLESLVSKKRNIKQAAMQELLTGKRRLPGFEGEWEVKKLGDISTISIGRTPSRTNQEYWGRGHTWLSIADLKSKIVNDSKEEITASAALTMSIIPKGTLLMSFKLSIGRLCFAGRDLFTNEAICSFNALDASGEFLYYVLGRTDFSLYGKQAVKGYTLNKESLQGVEVRLPSREEQDAIASVLSSIDDEILVLEERREKAMSIKQGMMQQLLTGKIRLT